MREIKFRAWDEDAGKMIYSGEERYDYDFRCDETGLLACLSEVERCDSYGEECSEWIKLPEAEQYTGLKDENGKEIYEGDILSDGNENVLAVAYIPEYAAFLLKGKRNGSAFYDYINAGMAQNYLEIIGNIHENPELLEASK